MKTEIQNKNISINTNRLNRGKTRNRGLMKESLQCYAMLAPMLIGFGLFTIYPMYWLIHWAFFNYDGIAFATFTGFDNFIRVFTRDPAYWASLLNTLIIVSAKMFIQMPLALVLAVLLNKSTRVNSFFRTAFFMPTIISTAIVGLVFFMMFNPYQGIVNGLLQVVGVKDPINWFNNRWLADGVIVIAEVWKNFGLNMIFFLMGLQSIPNELYECSDIDGASKRVQFFKITLPMLSPITKVVVMLSMVGSMKVVDLILVLTNGQPGGQTEVIMTYVFKYFFSYGVADSTNQYGYASALAVVTALVLAVLTMVYFRATKKMGDIY